MERHWIERRLKLGGGTLDPLGEMYMSDRVFYDGNAKLAMEKGYILFCTESGQVVKVKANTLGNGIKRLVGFFKDLEKVLAHRHYAHYEYLREDILKALKKYEIELEG